MELSLAEQVLLLSYDDDSGQPVVTLTNLDYGLSGALLLDLSFAGRITIRDGLVRVVDHTPVGDPVLDPILDRIGGESRHHSTDWWVYHAASRDHLQVLLDRLVERGYLVRERHRVIGIFPGRDRFPEGTGSPEQEIMQRLRDVITGTVSPDRRAVELLAVIHGCGLDRHLFPQMNRDDLRHRIADLTGSDQIGHSVGHVINAMNTAVLAAISGGIVSSPSAPATT